MKYFQRQTPLPDGVGTPVNILEGIERGVDMFDCVMPTRNGRNGMLFTKDGIINMRNKKWETDFSPIEADGPLAWIHCTARLICAIFSMRKSYWLCKSLDT